MTIDFGPHEVGVAGVMRRGDAANLHVRMGDRSGSASVVVYDARGRMVRVLLDRVLAARAVDRTQWDGTDRDGRGVAPGLYVVRLVAPGIQESAKILRL